MLRVLGVDVGTTDLVAAIWTDGQERVPGRLPHPPAGVAALETAVGGPPDRMLIEPTGGDELARAAWAIARGRVVCRPHPRHVRARARSQGRRARTDRQDALLLARYGATHDRPAWTALPSAVEDLERLLRRREDLAQVLRQERTRQQHLAHRPGVARAVPPSLEQVPGALEEALREGKEAIAAPQRQHPAIAAAVRLVRTVPGIGARHVLWVVVARARWQVLTGGTGTARGLTAYVGLDPTVHERGTCVRGARRIARQGLPQVRRLLVLGALGGVRGNGVNPLRDFPQRLVKAHQPKVVAYVAAARKILCGAWAVFQHQQPVDPRKASSKAALAA
ncbi:MAG: IS110 family transposase [Halothiobacillaceae bacterium]